VVVSYSHADEKWRDELRKFLKPLIRQKRIRIWDDTAIDAGEQWREEIKRALGSANIAILLISSDFLASDFISQQELPLLIDRAKKKDGGIRILWIAVRPCTFKLEPDVEELQALNDPSRPLSKLDKPAWETELTKVCGKILDAVQKAAASTAP
jgi:TIR domain-containing protein